MSEKINDSGRIPPLQEINFQGRTVYFKRASLVMGIFNGIGISQSLLEENNKHSEILIEFISKSPSHQKYNGRYLAPMDDFRKSTKKFANAYNDVQRFLSFSEMRLV